MENHFANFHSGKHPLFMDHFNQTTITVPLRHKIIISGLKSQHAKSPGNAIIRHATGFFPGQTTLQSIPVTELTGIHFNLAAKFEYKIEGVSGHIGSGQYLTTYIPETVCDCTVTGKYESLSLHFPLEYLEVLSEYFFDLKRLIAHVKSKSIFSVNSAPVKCSDDMLQLVNEVLHNHWPPSLRDEHLSVLVSDILLCCLNELNHIKNEDREKIETARQYLLIHLEDKQSLNMVADVVGLEVHKLRKGFNTLYHTTMFDFILNEKMKKALSYLTETDLPIRAISSRLGYRSLPAFSLLFKKKYGAYPGELRKVNISKALTRYES